jgi:hypothetical protein
MKTDNIITIIDGKEINLKDVLTKITEKYGKNPVFSSTYESAKKTSEILLSQK